MPLLTHGVTQVLNELLNFLDFLDHSRIFGLGLARVCNFHLGLRFSEFESLDRVSDKLLTRDEVIRAFVHFLSKQAQIFEQPLLSKLFL